MWGTVAFSFVLSMGLFFYLPIILTDLVVAEGEGSVVWNMVDGVFRVVMFVPVPVGGLQAAGHGAGLRVPRGRAQVASTPSRTAAPWTRTAPGPSPPCIPRCGTSFLFFVMLISIVVFCFLGRPETIADRLQRLAFVPLIGGLAYEAIKLSGKFAKAWFAQAGHLSRA